MIPMVIRVLPAPPFKAAMTILGTRRVVIISGLNFRGVWTHPPELYLFKLVLDAVSGLTLRASPKCRMAVPVGKGEIIRDSFNIPSSGFLD